MIMELDDDAAHEANKNGWRVDTKNLYWLLCSFIYIRVNGLEPTAQRREDLDSRLRSLIEYADRRNYE